MKTVVVKAANLRRGDIYEGRRIKAIHIYNYRIKKSKNISIPTNGRIYGKYAKEAKLGILIVTANPSGNKLDTFNFRGDRPVKIKRPIYNMRYAKKIKRKKV